MFESRRLLVNYMMSSQLMLSLRVLVLDYLLIALIALTACKGVHASPRILNVSLT